MKDRLLDKGSPEWLSEVDAAKPIEEPDAEGCNE